MTTKNSRFWRWSRTTYTSDHPLGVWKVLAAVPLLAPALALAAAWPQWRGPRRDEISTEAVRTNFGDQGPKLLWTFDKAGEGYSGPSIVGNLLYSLGADEKDFAFCMNTDS